MLRHAHYYAVKYAQSSGSLRYDPTHTVYEGAPFILYADVAALAYLIVDYLETWELEKRFVWSGNKGAVNTLFLISRYLPFVDVPLFMYYCNNPTPSPRECKRICSVIIALSLAAYIIIEALLLLRVHAISKQSRRTTTYIWCHLAVFSVTLITLLFLSIFSLGYYSSIRVESIDLVLHQPFGRGCHPKSDNKIYVSSMLSVMLLSQLIVISLTTIYGIPGITRRHLRSKLLTIIWKDGAIFFLVMSGISIVNVIISLEGLTEFHQCLIMFQRVINATFGTRMILHLRQVAAKERDTPLVDLSIHLNDLSTSTTG
ncbi:hypothetical protein CC2G_005154 [Coprinopsis cinerea AmutBmut pab1-1]|nr:hypothetical protein CC2G_005154 [Coprinopsis cinerea AmutBmut pab1-1]